MSEKKFVQGLIARPPHEKAPEYVKAKLSIKREELIAWLQSEQGEWLNAEVKVSQGGKWFVQLDDWTPNSNRGTTQRTERPQQQRQAPAADDFADDPLNW